MPASKFLTTLLSIVAVGVLSANSATASDVPRSSYSYERVIRIVPETNFYGSDYRSVEMLAYDDANDCAELCKNESRCRAFTFVPAYLQGPAPRCWLKDSWGGLSKVVKDRRITFGFVHIHAKIENATIWGSDYRDFDIPRYASPSTAVQQCANACRDDVNRNEAQCQSYTLVHGNHYGPSGNHRCWLKDGYSTPSAQQGKWSGYFTNAGL